jgi:hypothetical protein
VKLSEQFLFQSVCMYRIQNIFTCVPKLSSAKEVTRKSITPVKVNPAEESKQTFVPPSEISKNYEWQTESEDEEEKEEEGRTNPEMFMNDTSFVMNESDWKAYSLIERLDMTYLVNIQLKNKNCSNQVNLCCKKNRMLIEGFSN